jgi:hypothetical protein
MESTIAKYYTSKIAMEIAADAVQVQIHHIAADAAIDNLPARL